jgi:hypothetical protein
LGDKVGRDFRCWSVIGFEGRGRHVSFTGQSLYLKKAFKN